jgi:hypothetical protein
MWNGLFRAYFSTPSVHLLSLAGAYQCTILLWSQTRSSALRKKNNEMTLWPLGFLVQLEGVTHGSTFNRKKKTGKWLHSIAPLSFGTKKIDNWTKGAGSFCNPIQLASEIGIKSTTLFPQTRLRLVVWILSERFTSNQTTVQKFKCHRSFQIILGFFPL